MDEKLLLVKAITLLYRESHLKENADRSNDLVRTALETIAIPTITSVESIYIDTIRALKSTALEMCGSPPDTVYDKTSLLQTLRLNCANNDTIYQPLEQGIEPNLDDKSLARSITITKRSINNYFKVKKMESVLNKAAYELRVERNKIKDVNEWLANVITQLEPLQVSTSSKDAAIVSDLDIGDDAGMNTVLSGVKNKNNGSSIMRTGWKAVNDMFQGGFRRGEFIYIEALQHKYKTGGLLSLYVQIAMFNKPHMIDPTKKPLLLYIGFEDELESSLQSIYQYIKYCETRKHVSVDDVDIQYMKEYVRNNLRVNGYHIKMMRVDPSQWTYKSVCNKVIELEAQGYEIHAMMLDQLALVPTTGCTMGPTGTDLQDMFRRVKNFTSGKKITLITPHQLNTEAKKLLRNGMPEDRFVKEVSGKGYTAGCQSLDREADIIITQHLFKFKGKTYLALQWGKHRYPTVVDESFKYVLYLFPSQGMPIPHDLCDDRDTSFKSLKEAVEALGDSTRVSSDPFSF